MTDYADEIRVNQEAALATIKRIAESLPGFTFSSESNTLDGEAGLPCACDAKQPLTPTVRASGGQR